MYLAERTWTEVDAAPPRGAFVPIGSVEQHGPHAPLGTDLLIAEAVANRAASAIDMEVVVTPPVPVGIAEEHRAFAGSLWVSPDTFRDYVEEIAASLATHGIETVIFVNGHGGNVAALDEVVATLRRGDICRAAAFTWFRALADPPVPMGHGGAIETAAILAIDPTLIRDDRLEHAALGASERWGRWIGGTNLAVDVDEFSENGVVGDPREATAALGTELLDEATAALVRVFDALVDA